MSIFRSARDKETLIAWHHRFRERIGRPTTSRRFGTPFGDTHVLVAGPHDAPPLVLLHGALASSAHALSVVPTLADRYRVYAVDVVGQSPLSAETRPDVNGNAYGEWALACLESLQLTRTAVLGVSWGGFVACRLAAVAPERIAALSLVVPAGIVSGYGWKPLVKIALQMFTMDFRAPRNLRDHELAALRAPVQVIAAERDLMFPGARLIDRARRVFPNLQHTELLAGANHSPSTEPEAGRALAASIAGFLEGTDSPGS